MNKNNHIIPVRTGIYERLLSPDEVSDLTPYSGESVRRRCREGRIPGARLDGKRWLIPESALRKLGHIATPPTPAKVYDPNNPIDVEAFFRERDNALRIRGRNLNSKKRVTV